MIQSRHAKSGRLKIAKRSCRIQNINFVPTYIFILFYKLYQSEVNCCKKIKEVSKLRKILQVSIYIMNEKLR